MQPLAPKYTHSRRAPHEQRSLGRRHSRSLSESDPAERGDEGLELSDGRSESSEADQVTAALQELEKGRKPSRRTRVVWSDSDSSSEDGDSGAGVVPGVRTRSANIPAPDISDGYRFTPRVMVVPHSQFLVSLEWKPDARHVFVSASSDGRVCVNKVYPDAIEGILAAKSADPPPPPAVRCISSLSVKGGVSSVCWAGGGDYLLTASFNSKTLSLWDTSKLSLIIEDAENPSSTTAQTVPHVSEDEYDEDKSLPTASTPSKKSSKKSKHESDPEELHSISPTRPSAPSSPLPNSVPLRLNPPSKLASWTFPHGPSALRACPALSPASISSPTSDLAVAVSSAHIVVGDGGGNVWCLALGSMRAARMVTGNGGVTDMAYVRDPSTATPRLLLISARDSGQVQSHFVSLPPAFTLNATTFLPPVASVCAGMRRVGAWCADSSLRILDAVTLASLRIISLQSITTSPKDKTKTQPGDEPSAPSADASAALYRSRGALMSTCVAIGALNTTVHWIDITDSNEHQNGSPQTDSARGLLHTAYTHAPMTVLRCSPDDNLLVSGGVDGSVTLWTLDKHQMSPPKKKKKSRSGLDSKRTKDIQGSSLRVRDILVRTSPQVSKAARSEASVAASSLTNDRSSERSKTAEAPAESSSSDSNIRITVSSSEGPAASSLSERVHASDVSSYPNSSGEQLDSSGSASGDHFGTSASTEEQIVNLEGDEISSRFREGGDENLSEDRQSEVSERQEDENFSAQREGEDEVKPSESNLNAPNKTEEEEEEIEATHSEADEKREDEISSAREESETQDALPVISNEEGNLPLKETPSESSPQYEVDVEGDSEEPREDGSYQPRIQLDKIPTPAPLFPEPVLNMLSPYYSEHELKSIENRLRTPPGFTTLRVNTLRTDAQSLAATLNEMFADYCARTETTFAPHPTIPDLVVIPCKRDDSAEESMTLPPVFVDAGCGASMLRGSHAYLPGILGAAHHIRRGDSVDVWAVTGGVLRGAKLDTPPEGATFIGQGRVIVPLVVLLSAGAGIGLELEKGLYQCPPLNGVLPESMYLQTLPSVLVGHILDPQPGEVVLDMCSSPGGKTSHIATLMKGTGCVFAVDRGAGKALKVQSNARALGLKNVYVFAMDSAYLGTESPKSTNSAEFVAKAAHESPLPLPEKPGRLYVPPRSMDRVLLDAPCSCLGNRPQIAAATTNSEVSSQKRLIDAAVPLLKSGGVLVYSTCTFNPAENEEIVSYALKSHPGLRLDEIAPQWRLAGPGRSNCGLSDEERQKVLRFDPMDDSNTNGFFVARFTVIE